MQKGKMGHKVGVKILSDRQLENVLPTYQNLLHKIEVCRSVAEDKNEHMDKWNYQYNYMYDNVFSILGKRGTGKTSVAFTLQRKLQKKAEKLGNGDVILPLIIPEVIPENCSILGWLLAIVKDKIEELEESVKSKGMEDYPQNAIWKPCKYAQEETMTLRDRLDQIYKSFYSKNYNPSNENSYYKSVENSVLQAHGFYEVSKKIAELWDAWVDAIKFQKRNNKQEGERNITPMIYFIFDDVDLAPEKIGELLSVIVRYLSHPNIIVLTTADEELFLEVVENRLDRSMGRLPREWRNYLTNCQNQGHNYIFWDPIENEEFKEKQKTDIVSQTARMYLGKVLPASTRYYLRLFNAAKEKAEFYIEDESKLGMAIVSQIDEILASIGTMNLNMNFMKKGDNLIYYYLKFMGNTSRQIGNAFIALRELLLNVNDIITEEIELGENSDKVRVVEKVYQRIRYFLCVAINTNHQMSEVIGDVEDFVDEVFLAEYNHWHLYCNYAYLNEFLPRIMEDETKEKQIEIGQQIYALLAFVESLLFFLEGCLPQGITGRTKIYTAEFLAPFLQNAALNGRTVFRDDLDGKEFIWQYERILDRLSEVVNYESSEQKFDLEYLYHFRELENEFSAEDFWNMSKNNHKWFLEIVQMVTKVYGNVYTFGKKDMEGCFPEFSRNLRSKYQDMIMNGVVQNFHSVFEKIRMQDEIKSFQSYFNNVVSGNKKRFEDGVISENDVNAKDDTKTLESFVGELINNCTSGGISDAIVAVPRGNMKYIRLSSIIEDTVRRLQVTEYVWDKDSGKWNRFWQLCPSNVYKIIILEKEKMVNLKAEDIKELLLKCIDQVERLDNLGKKAVLSDPDVVVELLQELQQMETPYRRQIKAVLEGIEEFRKKRGRNEVVRELVISKELYNKFSRLGDMFWKMDKMGEEVDDKNTRRIREIGEELMGCMEIVIGINNFDEICKAVQGGIFFVWMKLLQRLYVYQVVSERYLRGTNTSSKALERNRKGDSYYYQMFKYIEICIEGKAKESNDDKIRWYLADEILKRDVGSAYIQERYQYINRLMDEVENGTV